MLEGDSNGGFARGGEAGEPYCEALLAAEGGAESGGEGAWVKGNVAADEVVSALQVGTFRILERANNSERRSSPAEQWEERGGYFKLQGRRMWKFGVVCPLTRGAWSMTQRPV